MDTIGCKFPEQLVTLCLDHKIAPPTTFERKVDEIWESLQDPRVTKIGVYGMPGIGKLLFSHILRNVFRRRETSLKTCFG